MVTAKNGKIILESREFLWEKDIKESFLSEEINKKSTRKTLRGILLKVDEYEKKLDKSIYNFTIDEIDDLLYAKFQNKSEAVVRSNISYISKYVKYCIKNNFVSHFENRFDLILSDTIENYVNKQAMEQKYITEEQLIEIENKLVNPRDQLIVELIYLGIRGRTEIEHTCEELKNITVEDAIKSYDTKKLIVRNDDNEQRIVIITDRTVRLLKNTIAATHYDLNNGEEIIKKNSKIKPEDFDEFGNKKEKKVKRYPFNDTKFVFRTAGKNKGLDPDEKMDAQLFNTSIRTIRKWVNNPYITITNLYFSGMINLAKKMKKKRKNLIIEDYLEICRIFNYGNSHNKSNEQYLKPLTYKIKSIIENYFKLQEELKLKKEKQDKEMQEQEQKLQQEENLKGI